MDTTSGRPRPRSPGFSAVPLLLLAAGYGVSGCYHAYRIVPDEGATGRVQQTGLTLLADADAWEGDPDDLPSHLTPIWVEIVNGTQADVAVNYAEFSLTDERGFRYPALNPYTRRAATDSQRAAPPPGPRPERGDERPPDEEPASDDHEPHPAEPDARAPERAPEYDVALSTGTRVIVAGRRFVRGRTLRGRRFYVYPRRRRYFRYYTPWPVVGYYPPYYGAHVHLWTPVYVRRPPSADVLRLGLPEGVVQPGGRVAGFVYFQNAHTRAQQLLLSWNAKTPGREPVAQLTIPFRVVRK